MKNLWNKLFGKKKEEPKDKDAWNYENTLRAFYQRSQHLQMGLTEEEVGMAVKNCMVEAVEEDRVFKLPPNYGSLLAEGYQANEPSIVPFVQRALDGGASLEDVVQWWNMPDLYRRMLTWEWWVRKKLLYQQKVAEGLEEWEAISYVSSIFPDFSAEDDLGAPDDESRLLPIELQHWAAKVLIEELSAEQVEAAAKQFPSMNAFLRMYKNGNVDTGN